MRQIISTVCAIASLIALPALPVAAQQTTVTGGMQNPTNSFFEGGGVGFNARGPNWFFTNGGGGVIPPFGGFDPNAGANLGFGFGGPGFSGSVSIGAAQGSSRGISSTAGSVTVPNGGSGSFAAVTQQPFVTGFTPVVGGFASDVRPHFGPAAITPAFNSTLFDERAARLQAGERAPEAALAAPASNTAPAAVAKDDPQQQQLAESKRSSAGQAGGGSIAEIRRRQAAEDEKLTKEIQTHLDQGRAAQAAGKSGVARIHFEQAARRATGAQKEEAQAALRALR